MRFSPKPTVTQVVDVPKDPEVVEEVKDIPVEAPVTLSRTAETSVNVRRDPDKDSPSLGVLYSGAKVEVESFDRDWYKIVKGEHKGGYVRRPYLK